MTLLSASCKKESTQIPDTEYQEIRSARITQVELTDKDFRQYFIYREDGLLDSVLREIGGISSPEFDILHIYHEAEQIQFKTFYDDNEESIKIFHEESKITGSEYIVRVTILLPPFLFGNKFNYSTDLSINSVDFYLEMRVILIRTSPI